MTEPVERYARAADLGNVERRVALKGSLTLRRKPSPATLCLTSRGLYVLAAEGAELGRAIDVLAEAHAVRLWSSTLGGKLQVLDLSFGVPAGRLRDVQQVIGLARLRQLGPKHDPLDFGGKHVERPAPLMQEALSRVLERGELLLAHVTTLTEAPFTDPIWPEQRAAVGFVLSDRRALLVACTDTGGFWQRELPALPLGVDGAHVRAGELQLRAARKQRALLLELAELPGFKRDERLREIARLSYVGGQRDKHLPRVRRWLELASGDGDGLAPAAQYLVSAELGEPEAARADAAAIVERLEQMRALPAQLAEVWSDWELSVSSGMALVRALRPLGDAAEPWALELHQLVHDAALEAAAGTQARAEASIELARHHIDCGRRADACALLERCLGELPSQSIEDLLPDRDVDLTRSASSSSLRVRAYELLAIARGSADHPDAAALLELTRLEPLVVERARALCERVEAGARPRAEQALKALLPLGLTEGLLADDPPETVELSEDDVELMRHPLARRGSALLGRLQALLAAAPVPEHAILRDYVEQLTPERHAGAARALAQAARVFGLERIEGYISRGNKAIGLRVYEADPPFLLIGGRHLEPGEYAMTPRQLRFAIGAELAHLYFGHSRVTSSEVWAGALNKSWQSIDLALGILPMLGGFKLANRLSQLASRVPTETLERVLMAASELSVHGARWLRPDASSGEVLSRLNEEVVATHRLMQLTADRAGLVLAGDLRSALRSMLLVRPDYREQLRLLDGQGLAVLLGQRGDDGKMRFQDLAVRVAALISFLLSEDYLDLMRSVYPGVPG